MFCKCKSLPLTKRCLTCLLLHFDSVGLLLLCQHHYCDQLSTQHSLASSSELETKDLTTILSTTSKSRRSSSSQRDDASVLTKTSIISTTTTHTTRLHRIITDASNDETLIDVTTSIDALCLTKTNDDDDASDNFSIKSLDGDIIVTIILDSLDNATAIIKFIVNHINGIDLLVHNVSIGELRWEIST